MKGRKNARPPPRYRRAAREHIAELWGRRGSSQVKRNELYGHKLEWWYSYMAHEREALLLRACGALTYTLRGYALKGELPEDSRKELEKLATEEQRLAREGLVRLLGEDGEEASYKHIDELTPKDIPARRRAELAQMSFLKERLAFWPRAPQALRAIHRADESIGGYSSGGGRP